MPFADLLLLVSFPHLQNGHSMSVLPNTQVLVGIECGGVLSTP